MRLPDSFKPTRRGMRLPGDESPTIGMSEHVLHARRAIGAGWNSHAGQVIATCVLWLLLVPLPSWLFSGKLGAWPVLIELVTFAAYSALRCRKRDVRGGSLSRENALWGTLAGALGCALWLVAVRPGEYLLFFLVVGVVPMLVLWVALLVIATLVERATTTRASK